MHPFLALGISVMLFFLGLLFVKESWFGFYFLGIIAAYLAFGYRGEMLRVFLVFLPFALIAYLLTFLSTAPEDRFYSLFRMAVIAAAAVPVMTLSPTRFVRALNQVHAPRWLTLGLFMALRFAVLLREEIVKIKQAIRLRGITFFKQPLLWLRSFVLPLFVRILSISDTMSVSLETRGFSMDTQATQFKRVHWKLRDTAMLVFVSVFHGYCLWQFSQGGVLPWL